MLDCDRAVDYFIPAAALAVPLRLMSAEAVLLAPDSPPPSSPLRRSRQAYLEWVEEQVESFKENIPRSELLCFADEVVSDLRVTRGGQYQLTEVLLCAAIDRRIFRALKLPSYREWLRERGEASR